MAVFNVSHCTGMASRARHAASIVHGFTCARLGLFNNVVIVLLKVVTVIMKTFFLRKMVKRENRDCAYLSSNYPKASS